MKEAKSYIEVILMVFLENSHLGQLGNFGPKDGVSFGLWILSKDFFERG